MLAANAKDPTEGSFASLGHVKRNTVTWPRGLAIASLYAAGGLGISLLASLRFRNPRFLNLDEFRTNL